MEACMVRFATLAVVAAAVVLGWYSGDMLLALAAICGACGVVTLMSTPTGLAHRR